MLPADEDTWRMFNIFNWNGTHIGLVPFSHVSPPNLIWGMKKALNDVEQYGALKPSTDPSADNIFMVS